MLGEGLCSMGLSRTIPKVTNIISAELGENIYDVQTLQNHNGAKQGVRTREGNGVSEANNNTYTD